MPAVAAVQWPSGQCSPSPLRLRLLAGVGPCHQVAIESSTALLCLGGCSGRSEQRVAVLRLAVAEEGGAGARGT
jgi:hypothetical protein